MYSKHFATFQKVHTTSFLNIHVGDEKWICSICAIPLLRSATLCRVNGLSPGFLQALLPLDPGLSTNWDRGRLERAGHQVWS